MRCSPDFVVLVTVLTINVACIAAQAQAPSYSIASVLSLV